MSWNGSNNATPTAGKRPATQGTKHKAQGTKHGLLAGLIVVALGGAAVWWFFGRPPAPTKHEAPSTKHEIAEVAPAIVTNKVEAAIETTNRNVRMENGVEVLRSEVSTNKNGAVTERLWLADGTTKRKIRPPKPVFENPSDQLIAMALSAKPGQSMPPLPGLADVDADFAKAMLSPIRIEESDSDEIKDLKSRVIEARAYLAEEVKNGGTVREALRKYQVDMEKYADSHLMAVEQIKKIRETEGDDAAKEFRDRVNESFRQRGIPELEAPKTDSTQRRNKQ